jgi:hypothetical protein
MNLRPQPARNNIAAGKALLADIDAWTLRTGTPEGKIGGVLFRHPGFVGLLRKRLIVTPESEKAVRDFLAQYPMGASHVEAPNPHMKTPKLSPQLAQRRLVASVGRGCPKCGATDGRRCRYPTCPMREGRDA